MVTDYSEVLANLSESLARPDGDAHRVFHGRGGCYPGLEFLTLDDFGGGLWLVLFKEPEPETWLAFLVQLEALAVGSRQFCVVQHRYRKPVEAQSLWGELPEELTAREAGLRYHLALQGRQNTGYFMDASPGRIWLKERVEGRSVLNLFAYTCAFSVAALDGDAHSVVNVDMAKSALNTGRENHRLNGQSLSEITFLPYDIFRSWKRIRELGPYDCIVIDPPSLQRGSFDARKDYARVVKRLPELASDGADILLCLNAPYIEIGFLQALAAEFLPGTEVVGPLKGREDFPERSAALKMLHLRYQRSARN